MIVGQAAWRPATLHGHTGVARAMSSMWVFGRITSDERGWPAVLLAPLLLRDDSPDSEVLLDVVLVLIYNLLSDPSTECRAYEIPPAGFCFRSDPL